jgi:hypothetical protein
MLHPHDVKRRPPYDLPEWQTLLGMVVVIAIVGGIAWLWGL